MVMNSGHQRATWATMKRTPAFSQAATMRSKDSTVKVMGFSQITCMPRPAASSTQASCRSVGRQMSTTFAPASLASFRVFTHLQPYSSATLPQVSGFLPMTATISTSSIFFSAPKWFWAM